MLRPPAARVMRQEIPVGVDGPDALGVLKIAPRFELSNPVARLVHELTVGMLVNETLPGLARIRGLGGAPVLLLLATCGGHARPNRDKGNSSCPECDHGRHPWRTSFVL